MSLPPMYDRWMREALGRQLHNESRSTCLSCPMSVESTDRPKQVAWFHPRSKCCTYLPVLCNFHVGLVLLDDDPAMADGRRTVLERMERGIAMTPLGLAWPGEYERRYDAKKDHEFGTRVDMLCPHYIDRDGGLCGVWKYRNGICSTWFCRHERGKLGAEVWTKVEEVLELVEDVLTRMCLEFLQVEPALAERLNSSDEPVDTLNGDVEITEARRKAVWGRWFGREREFYERCGRYVQTVQWSSVVAMGGARLRSRLESLEDALADHDQEALPPFVRSWSVKPILDDGQETWMYGHRLFDVEPMPNDLFDLLFDLPTISTDDLMSRLVEEHQVGEPEEAIRGWLDQGYLRATLPD